MSISFSRPQLVRVAKAALAADTKARTEYLKACDAFRDRHRRDNTNTDRLRRLRDHLTKGLKGNTALLDRKATRKVFGVSDIEHLFYTGPDDYNVRQAVTAPKELLSAGERIEISALLKVLEAATGEEVTANELKLVGFKNLSPVFTAAAAEVRQ